jgi:hypothetical protein
MIILEICGGVLTAIYIVFFIVVSAYFRAKQRADNALKDILVCKNHASKFNTGDIILLNYKSMSTFRGFENVPFHCGMVYVKNGQNFVIEATRFQHPYLVDQKWNKKDGGGVRLVLLDDLVNSVDLYMVVRQLVAGKINCDDLEYNLNSWARHLEFS